MQTWIDLPYLHAIRISGADAIEFCQSQFTADFRELPQGQWQVCAWCNPKGRCLAIILASAGEGHVDLIAPRAQAEVLARLRMYAIGRKVEFSESWSVSGHDATGDLADAVRLPDGRALRLDELPGNPDPGRVLEWRIADLCLPVPWLNEHSSGRYLPQFLGLEAVGGLSYRKGCFPGQEVIARLHYLGKVKHRLTGFVLDSADSETELEPGLLVAAGSNQSIEPLESVRINQRWIGLAVCPTELPDGERIEYHGPDGPFSGQVTDPKGLCYYRNINND